ncbi:MAG: hypothetical protein V9E94_08220 [Microthrixaceae bacterium]
MTSQAVVTPINSEAAVTAAANEIDLIARSRVNRLHNVSRTGSEPCSVARMTR